MPRPNYKPTEKDLAVVKAMAAHGIGHEQIAAELEITPKTLRKHFRTELTRGPIRVHLSIRQSLLAQAVSRRNIAATIYADKLWSALVAKQSQPDGQPTPPPQILFREDGRRSKLPPEDRTNE